MKINSLTIQNFRSLESLILPELGRINLLVGKNNSGKTSVLESLRVLSSRGAIKTLIELAVEREDQVQDETLDEEVSIKRLISGIFKDHAIDAKEIFIGDSKGDTNLSLKRSQYVFLREETPNGLFVGKRQLLSDDEITRLEFEESEEVDIRDGLEISVNGRESELVRIDRAANRPSLDNVGESKEPVAACAFVPAQPKDVDELAILWDQIALSDREQAVVKALKLIEPSIAALTFVEADPNMEEIRRRLLRRPRMISSKASRRIPIVRLEGSNLRVPLRSMGDGLHRILDVVLRLVAIQDGFLLVDEFENGLHYSIHDRLWELVLKISTERSVQVFATTHSDDCVGAFSRVSLASEEAGVLYRIARPTSDQNAHFVRRYSEQTLLDAKEADVEVR